MSCEGLPEEDRWGSTIMTPDRRCQRQRIERLGIAPAQAFVCRFRPVHALIERIAADRPAVFAVGAAMQRMNPISFGGGETGRGGLRGKICRQDETYDEAYRYPYVTMWFHGARPCKIAFYISRYSPPGAGYPVSRQNVGISTRCTDTNCDLNVRQSGNLRPSVCL